MPVLQQQVPLLSALQRLAVLQLPAQLQQVQFPVQQLLVPVPQLVQLQQPLQQALRQELQRSLQKSYCFDPEPESAAPHRESIQ